MTEVDIVVVGYRSEAYLPRLFSDVKDLSAREHKIHYFDNTGNPRTLSALWNELAAAGQAKYLAILNPDIALSPAWDERLIACLKNNPDIGLVTADPTPFALEPPAREVMVRLSKERAGRTDTSGNPVQFFVAFMERWTWSALRGVDERMRFYMQDIDLIVRMWERLQRRTVRVFSCPVWHYGSASTRDANDRKEIDSQRECDFGSAVFNEVRHGRLKEWQTLTESERAEIRRHTDFSKIPKGIQQLPPEGVKDTILGVVDRGIS